MTTTKRLDVKDYPNASDGFKRDVAFFNDVMDKVDTKISSQAQSLLGDSIKAKPSPGIVHSSENIMKPKSSLFAKAKARALKNLHLNNGDGATIGIKNSKP